MGAKCCVFSVVLPTGGEGEKKAGGEEGMKMVMIKLRMEEASEAAGRVALPAAPSVQTAPSSGAAWRRCPLRSVMGHGSGFT